MKMHFIQVDGDQVILSRSELQEKIDAECERQQFLKNAVLALHHSMGIVDCLSGILLEASEVESITKNVSITKSQ